MAEENFQLKIKPLEKVRKVKNKDITYRLTIKIDKLRFNKDTINGQ